MRKYLFTALLAVSFIMTSAQTPMSDGLRSAKDSTLHAKETSMRRMFREDSIKIEKEFADKARWERIEAKAIYPLFNAGKNSGVIPVKNASEIPDPNIEYKLLFEITGNNPDSAAKEINNSLAEVARVINLHVASGIPKNKIRPVVLVHAAALHALKTDEAYHKKYKMNNPNISLIRDMEKLGTRFIACGQAMEFFEVKKEDLLPGTKISLTVQTALTQYQLQGYVLKQVW